MMSEIQYVWPDTLTPQDQTLVAKLIVKVSATDPIVGFRHEVTEVEVQRYLNKLTQDLNDGRIHIMLGKKSAEQLVSMVVLAPNGSPNNKHIADMSKGMIDHEFRGSGVLQDSFRSIIARAKALGVELLTLDVRDGTPARQVWLKLGFEDYGMLDDYARVDGEVFAGFYMKQKVVDLAKRLEN